MKRENQSGVVQRYKILGQNASFLAKKNSCNEIWTIKGD
jgi:hypothetical protein